MVMPILIAIGAIIARTSAWSDPSYRLHFTSPAAGENVTMRDGSITTVTWNWNAAAFAGAEDTVHIYLMIEGSTSALGLIGKAAVTAGSISWVAGELDEPPGNYWLVATLDGQRYPQHTNTHNISGPLPSYVSMTGRQALRELVIDITLYP